MKKVKVYVAGPFFTQAEERFMREVKEGLSGAGVEVEVRTPLDIGYVAGGSAEVFEADLRAIRECDTLVAILDGHDAGTMCEIGYARALGKRVVGIWTDKERRLDPFVKWLCDEVVTSLKELRKKV